MELLCFCSFYIFWANGRFCLQCLGALGSFYAELSLNWKPDDCNWCDFAKPKRKKPPNMRIKDGFLHFIASEEQWEETFPNIVLQRIITLTIALYKDLDVIFFRGSDNCSGSGSNLNNT